MKKNWLLYLVALVVFGTGIAFILEYGSRLNNGPAAIDQPTGIKPAHVPPAATDSFDNALVRIGKVLRENLQSPLSKLLVQIIVIVISAKLFGRFFQKFNQPAVIGEMIAGILLGPSLLGLISPQTMSFIFPDASLGTLRLLSQLGVIIFMFTVGMELSVQHLKERAHAAVVISHASIVVPFFLGVALSLFIYRRLAPPHIPFVAFALFIGIAMSITAFPVLARILEERRISQTTIGTMALACAAVDDVTAWCILAIVVAVSNAAGLNASLAPILLSLLFIGAMVFFIKPLLGRFIKHELADEKRGRLIIAGIVAFVFACAWFTELIGIHALFGGFLAGVVMPADVKFRTYLKDRFEPFSTAVLLPLFFAFTGLRTQVNLLGDWQSVLIGAAVIAVAIAGKLGGSMLTARWTGMSWRESFSIGALMNTRGLVELIVLNIGYDLGILPDRIFAIMVLMALITTCMTGPLLSLAIKQETVIKAPLRFAGDEPAGSQ